MKDVLGGKGAGLAEMTNIGVPVPPGFTISTDVCTYFYAHDKTLSAGAEGRGRREPRARREIGRPQLRRREAAAARLRPLRRARVDARHDGHDPQPRPQRRNRAGSGEVVERRALRARFLSPLHPDVLRRRARRSTRITSSTSSSRCATRSGVKTDAEIPADGLRGLVETYKGDRPREERQRLPAGRAASSSGARSARSSTPGTTSAPSPTAS